jgi:hypothetical protein
MQVNFKHSDKDTEQQLKYHASFRLVYTCMQFLVRFSSDAREQLDGL